MAIAMPGYDGLSNWSERVWRTAGLYGVVGAYPTAVVLGLPAYLTLRRHFAAQPFACALAGFVVAALPWTLLVLAGSGASQASIDGRATVIDGHTTAYGWLQNIEMLLTIGTFGAIGGLVFWAVAAAGLRFADPPGEQQSST